MSNEILRFWRGWRDLNSRLTCFMHAFYILSLSLIPCGKDGQTDLYRRGSLNSAYATRPGAHTVPRLKMMPLACQRDTGAEHTLIRQRKRDCYCLRLNLKYRFYEAESFGMLTVNATGNRNRFIPELRQQDAAYTVYSVFQKIATVKSEKA